MSDKKPLFKILEGTRVKAGDGGYYYVCTDPPHEKNKGGIVLPDRNKVYVYEHVAVLELKLGRYLDFDKGEQADHKNGKKDDNRPENLQSSFLGSHQRSHVLDRGNHFWEKSPMNKKRASVSNLVQGTLKIYFNS
jgi:hypothetical protein